jgi:hypothetical protein
MSVWTAKFLLSFLAIRWGLIAVSDCIRVHVHVVCSAKEKTEIAVWLPVTEHNSLIVFAVDIYL